MNLSNHHWLCGAAALLALTLYGGTGFAQDITPANAAVSASKQAVAEKNKTKATQLQAVMVTVELRKQKLRAHC